MTLVMLNHFKIKSVRLLTNNPLKVEALQQLGIDVVERVPLHVGLNPNNLVYINTKKNRMGHLHA
jgi:GTP cyclohydrolase II